MFLTDAEIATLTGRKVKAKQIAALRAMGIAFYVNAVGKPIVARSTIEGRPGPAATPGPPAAWRSNMLTPALGVRHGQKTNRQPLTA